MEPVRVASVGIGWWSGELANAIPKGTNLTLVACATRSPEKRAAFAAKYGCRQAASYEAVLADPEVEGILLTTPHTLHAEHIIAAAQAKKHVFVEKPFTLSAADGRRATAACRQAGVVLAVGHGRRRQAANRALKGLIEQGALGRVVQIESNISSNSGFRMTPGGWRTDPKEQPAGAMTGLGIHTVDTFQYLVGPIVRVAAFSVRQVLRQVEIYDTTGIVMEFASGALGYLGTGFVVANRTNLLAAHGTAAQAFADGEASKLFLQKQGESEPSPVPVEPVDWIAEELAEFGRCIREGGRPEVGGEEGTDNVAVLEAIIESNRTRMPAFTWNELPQGLIDPAHAPGGGKAYRGDKIGVERCRYPAGSAVAPHAVSFEQIHCILQGKAAYRVGGEARSVGPGEAVLIRAGLEHALQALEETEVLAFADVGPVATAGQAPSQGPAFFKWEELKSDFITPKYSSGRGPVVSGDRIEVAYMFYPGGTEAKTHSHPNEQIQIALKGRVKYFIGSDEYVIGPEGGILMPIGLEHAVEVLEDYTVINCKDIVPGFSVYHAAWQK
jgi:predicted dehydrogenase/quercetin dioxygenase-like cupin family protein